MKGLILRGPSNLEYAFTPDPQLANAEDAIIKVERCGICGSDLHTFRGNGLSQVAHGATFQGCIGHEAIGEVVEVGSAVLGYRAGDKVMLSAAVGCGKCEPCQSRNPAKCQGIGFRTYGGLSGLGGCQSEAVLVPAADFNLALIPDGVSPDQALMLTDNLAVAFMACTNAEISPGKTVAIIGLGPIGLMAVECAFTMGAERVFAIDPVGERRAVAERLGAAAMTPESAIEQISNDTKGMMVECVVDAAGGVNPILLGFDIAGKQATLSSVGMNTGSIDFPLGKALLKGLTFRTGVCPVARYWPMLIPMVQSGRLRPEQFVSHVLPLEQGPAAYAMLDGKSEDALKIVLTP